MIRRPPRSTLFPSATLCPSAPAESCSGLVATRSFRLQGYDCTVGEHEMSQTKVLGPVAAAGATAATLPVTGNNVVTAVLVGLALVAGGLLMVRSARTRRTDA